MPQYPPNRQLNSATKGIAIVADTPFNPCVAVNCTTTAGISVVTWLDGSTSNFYFALGTNHLQITNVAAGGGAAGLVALYNS